MCLRLANVFFLFQILPRYIQHIIEGRNNKNIDKNELQFVLKEPKAGHRDFQKHTTLTVQTKMKYVEIQIVRLTCRSCSFGKRLKGGMTYWFVMVK